MPREYIQFALFEYKRRKKRRFGDQFSFVTAKIVSIKFFSVRDQLEQFAPICIQLSYYVPVAIKPVVVPLEPA